MEYYNPHFLFCTFFGVGKVSKKMPGTLGSLVAIPLAYVLKIISVFILRNFTNSESEITWYFLPIIITLALFLAGIYSANYYSKAINKGDPGEIIIDEILGQILCVLTTIPMTFGILYNNFSPEIFYYDLILIGSIVGNFILFRAFDILKPWPINYIDSKLKGGIGIMLDDFLAAIFSIILYFAILLAIVDYYVR